MPKQPTIYSSVARDSNHSPGGVRFSADPALLDDEPAGEGPKIDGRVAFSAGTWPAADVAVSCRVVGVHGGREGWGGDGAWFCRDQKKAIDWLLGLPEGDL